MTVYSLDAGSTVNPNLTIKNTSTLNGIEQAASFDLVISMTTVANNTTTFTFDGKSAQDSLTINLGWLAGETKTLSPSMKVPAFDSANADNNIRTMTVKLLVHSGDSSNGMTLDTKIITIWIAPVVVTTLSGYVKDSTGAAIIGAQVKLTNPGNGNTIQTTTVNSSGYYTFSGLNDWVNKYIGVTASNTGLYTVGVASGVNSLAAGANTLNFTLYKVAETGAYLNINCYANYAGDDPRNIISRLDLSNVYLKDPNLSRLDTQLYLWDSSGVYRGTFYTVNGQLSIFLNIGDYKVQVYTPGFIRYSYDDLRVNTLDQTLTIGLVPGLDGVSISGSFDSTGITITVKNESLNLSPWVYYQAQVGVWVPLNAAGRAANSGLGYTWIDTLGFEYTTPIPDASTWLVAGPGNETRFPSKGTSREYFLPYIKNIDQVNFGERFPANGWVNLPVTELWGNIIVIGSSFGSTGLFPIKGYATNDRNPLNIPPPSGGGTVTPPPVTPPPEDTVAFLIKPINFPESTPDWDHYYIYYNPPDGSQFELLGTDGSECIPINIYAVGTHWGSPIEPGGSFTVWLAHSDGSYDPASKTSMAFIQVNNEKILWNWINGAVTNGT